MSLLYEIRLRNRRVDIHRLASQYKRHEYVGCSESIPVDTPAGSEPPPVVGEDQPTVGIRNRNQVETDKDSSRERDHYSLR
ncbi:hypothetical protein AGABI1DRAFT_110867 [Agaricus bisporus var. burnettii JB137-S8]|uniref:Uncharacterized protein n=1 Tax=Agaricus bisporus var. burnettii (strain JB137-S8 / ATCC MYA-4627 / FGSC 10392) TaxID=597362 RepID=K5Y7S0_AGABU|nr:uncharacterized protein AGABI1DRAFT_110867 [Agaricus bisporus var. burnettii JB137-S8]EKM84325.1 hypothetical protein AGABI1DRAFT_110867 [Agaricus bisporus var. burnettii JB137-S8]